MAGYSNGRLPSDLFASADADDAAVRAAGGANDMSPDALASDPDPDFIGGWGDMVRRPTPSPPWLDEAVIRYGQTGQPSLKIGSGDAAIERPAPESKPYIPLIPGAPVRFGPQDPNGPYSEKACPPGRMTDMANDLAQTVKSKPDWQSHEYGSAFSGNFNNPKHTPLVRLEREGSGHLYYPDGMKPTAEFHNHPYIAGLKLAEAQAGATEASDKNYLDNILPGPSLVDIDSFRKRGARFVHYILGPDGRVRCF